MQNEATLTRGVKEFALGPKEFVGMMASLMAMNALAIDAMLPALGFISRDYGLSDPNARQWIVSAYLIGTGLGAVFYGGGRLSALKRAAGGGVALDAPTSESARWRRRYPTGRS